MNEDGTYRVPYSIGDVLFGGMPSAVEDYHRHLKYLDNVFGQIVQRLKLAGKYDGTMIVITSDHSWRHEPEQSTGRSVNLADIGYRRVPLLIKFPGQKSSHSSNKTIYNHLALRPFIELVLRGKAHETLVDSYEAERQPIAKALLETTDAATRGMTRAVSLRHPIAVGLRNQLMSLVTSMGAFRSRLTHQLSMLNLDYRESPIVRQDRASLWRANVTASDDSELPSLMDWAAFGEGPAAGDRAEDVLFESPVNGVERLYDLLRGTRHVLFLFDGAAATDEGYANLTDIARRVTERYAALVDVHVVIPRATTPEALKWDGSVLHDADGAVHRSYGARSECLYLVRPDGYVGYRNQPAEGDRLMAYLTSFFTE